MKGIYSVKSPYIFRPFFKWFFWKQLRRNKCCYGNPYCDQCYGGYGPFGYGYGPYDGYGYGHKHKGHKGHGFSEVQAEIIEA